jgi:glycogen debranching enzyme
VRTSNAGHALFTGIASPERARRVADYLMSRDGFSGWGIRTLGQGEPRYNPLSYHNGSVWPHDNALIAIGFARYGLKAHAVRVFEGMFDAARHQELRRLPELFCGLLRRPRREPTPYPVACSPQAWAAAAIYALLGACVGLEQDNAKDEIRFQDPVLPQCMDEVVFRDIHLGESRVDLRMHRYGADVSMTVLSRRGTAKIIVAK